MNLDGDVPYEELIRQRAIALASDLEVGPAPAATIDILSNLRDVSDWLKNARIYCSNPISSHSRAADWLLDNDYQVIRAVRALGRDMPSEFYNRLNGTLKNGVPLGPRIFVIAHTIIDAARFRLTSDVIVQFLDAFQKTSHLASAELWALPSMLRLAGLEVIVEGFSELNSDLTPQFEISRFAAEGHEDNPTDRIARGIGALTLVQTIDWRDIIDQVSPIEALLHADPAKVYARMDFATRNRYRKAVEDLSDGSAKSEETVALAALDLAATNEFDQRKHHVGYWLVDAGRSDLEHRLDYRTSIGIWLQRFVLRHAGLLYSTAVMLLMLVTLGLPMLYLAQTSAGISVLAGGFLLSFIPATVISIAILHRMITRFTQPNVLPMMNFRKGIPVDSPTCVVVPVIISKAADIEHLIERMEIRRLSNPDPMLRFVLLSDFPDASAETALGDDEIRRSLRTSIDNLNKRHADSRGGPFFLLHRPRKYNPTEVCWMGWERKRGKLEDFNALVVEGKGDGFDEIVGDIDQLRETRFVITLDADTSLPPGSAARLVGTLAHPLNHAVIDPETRKAVAGYTIIQPRIEILPLKGAISSFSRLHAGNTAIDIYSRAVSDVYQDLFGTGIFVGKGIYDVASMHTCLSNRVPENTILSHDLFEGLFGRAALASNIVLYEDFPATYPEYASRLHRWIRGDWQLVPWLLPRALRSEGVAADNTLSGLDRWKIVDNLRRSLVAPSLLLFFVAGWALLPGSPWLWTALAAAAPAAYLLGDIYAILARDMGRMRVGDLSNRIGERFGRWILTLTFLVSDTAVSLDAIVRTLWRLLVTRRHLLEWRSAAHVSASLSEGNNRGNTWQLMWPSAGFAGLLATYLAIIDTNSLIPAAPFLALWIIAPEIAILLGKPRLPRRENLDETERDYLKLVARRTWLYFETFAGPADNWLPPDNYQEIPRGEIAHRTSPTNIGLLLSSTQAALDFGFIGTNDFAARIRNVITTIEQLETYHGHVLNWYDTITLGALEPRYVSTVDSGNLAICLISLSQGCRDVACGSTLGPEIWDGLDCTLDLLIKSLRKLSAIDQTVIDAYASEFGSALDRVRQAESNWFNILSEIDGHLWPKLESYIIDRIAASSNIDETDLEEVHIWNERVHHHLRALDRDIDVFAPWLKVAAEAPIGAETLASDVLKALTAELNFKCLDERTNRSLAILGSASAANTGNTDCKTWITCMRSAIHAGCTARRELQTSILELANRADAIAFGMDFKVLYNPEVRLFHIGFNVSSGLLDANHYDLLATEARLASFFAIAKHDVPVKHWFALGRPLTRLNGRPAVLSWNGSMFEYLMAPLFLPGQRDTLLGESESTAVDYQRRYASQFDVPWGITESAFSTTDLEGNYQYQAFGAPSLGLRRGLSNDLVVAPYASALALCCWPKSAVANLRELARLGAMGSYGFFDAVDFTPDRNSQDARYTIVRNYMAHHHGMTMAAIANVLEDDVFVHRVLSAQEMQTIEMLLQERVPWDVQIEEGRTDEERQTSEKQHTVVQLPSWLPSNRATVPQLHMFGNGSMANWITETGTGCLSRQGFALTRWSPDSAHHQFGYFIYIRDSESGNIWSATDAPTGKIGEGGRVVFRQHMVETFRRDYGIAVRMEAVISAADDTDIRKLSVTNESPVKRHIEFTSYAEVVLAPPLDDERHPAFSKLFVSSIYRANQNALLFERRAKRPEDEPPVLLHRLVADDATIAVTDYETDRGRFVGRLGNLQAPKGLADGLSRTTGWTMDPVMSLQTELSLDPGETKHFSFLTVAADTQDQILRISDHYNPATIETTINDAGKAAARDVGQLNIDPSQLPALQVLGSLLQMPHVRLREMPVAVGANRTSQPDLWKFGISGDHPILLLRIDSKVPSDLLSLLANAQRLWRRAGAITDIAVLLSEAAGYETPLRERILSMLRGVDAYASLGINGGIHLLSAASMAADLRARLCASAHIVLRDDNSPLEAMLDAILENRPTPSRFIPASPELGHTTEIMTYHSGLEFDNGFGGFEPESGNYIIHLETGETTPAPWCNVLANDSFGTIVSESGLGFTWAINSGENRLTPWSNDPVCDTPGEVLYLRDEQTGEVWTPTLSPIGRDAASQVRHGAGWSTWTKHSHGIEQELRAFVAHDDPVKLVTLRLSNQTDETRRITATYYAEWLLGALTSQAKAHTVCEYDAVNRAILANNAWNPEFSERVAFLTATLPPHSIGGSRFDFLGKNGGKADPDALKNWDLGGKFQPGTDACAAYQCHLDIEPQATIDVTFILGQGADQAKTRALIKKWNDPAQIEVGLGDLRTSWNEKLGAVQIQSPDPAFNLMTNRWLLYQTISCRLLARAGFYQAGGAFGYRDQLQDVLALLFADPATVRNHIVLAASHQFEEGDALHWWHPPAGRGVRTRCSDDYIWLAYVTAQYIEATGDLSVLDERVPFLSGQALLADEMDRYALYNIGSGATVLEHCKRALLRMMSTGSHGLPLMGSGDWNDGMDRVGDKGRGESVWLAWFQITTIDKFIPMLEPDREEGLRETLINYRRALKSALNEHAWDGEWFVRAFDDDGVPWGSHMNDECQIDTIAQSWSALSGAASSGRAETAMNSAQSRLVHEDERLIQLLDPPFQFTPREPGYIRAYPPGVRENGGQYTHAAAWLGHAFAALGDGDEAWRIFDLINPIRRSNTPEDAHRYAREPYVLAGDVYGPGQSLGLGGWSWYTGAAAWTWRLGVEAIMGLRLVGGDLEIRPCLPRKWGGAEAVIKGPNGTIKVIIQDPDHLGHGDLQTIIDSRPAKDNGPIPFPGKGATRNVEVTVRRPARTSSD